MKTRYAQTFLAVGFCTLVGIESAEARNRTSLVGNIQKALAARKARKLPSPVPVGLPDPGAPAGRSHPAESLQAVPHSGPAHADPRRAPPPSHDRSDRKRGRNSESPTVAEIRRRAERIARNGLRYKFGGDSPSEGGMDCSGTMKYLLGGMGVRGIPRTSYAQFEWVKNSGNLRRKGWGSDAEAYRNLQPGDLIFWGGTYDSGHRVSHVMIYLGRDRQGRHYMFGARSESSRGLHGSGVDIFELKPGQHGRLVGYGKVPGLRV